jgi:hypothetical protein
MKRNEKLGRLVATSFSHEGVNLVNSFLKNGYFGRKLEAVFII